MSNSNGHHYSKFSWRDWSADKALHPCSLAAKGFWIEMLCIMHEGTPIGHLTLNGKPATVRQMAANAGCTEREAAKCLAELLDAGVCSKNENGVIFCRRMVKDAEASQVGRNYAEKRWNPQKSSPPPNGSPNGSPNGEANRTPNAQAYRDPNAKSQSQNSESESERPTPLPPTGWGDGTPAAPGTPPAGRRSNGSNPRAEGTNPRAAGRRDGYVSGGIAVLADRLRQRAEAHRNDDLTDARSCFDGLRIMDGSHG